ncbi:MAG: hypothetical protein JOZ30_19615 [Hyphomicrobiales bacterium]|nr:hypothetical protein [Hyphomicrobiales bacterium]
MNNSEFSWKQREPSTSGGSVDSKISKRFKVSKPLIRQLARHIGEQSLSKNRGCGPKLVTILQHLCENTASSGQNYRKKVEHAFATSMVAMWREGPAASVIDFLFLWEPEARAGLG